MIENQPKLDADWTGWPSDDELAGYNEVGLTSRPYGTVLEERFPPADVPALPDAPAIPDFFPVRFDLAEREFAQADAQELFERFLDQDNLSIGELSRPDSRKVILGEERRLPFQPGVPLWVLAWREAVSRSRRWTTAERVRSLLAGAWYRAYLRASFMHPDHDWSEAGDFFCENLYKSPAPYGNGRSLDLGDRPDIPNFPPDWCGAASSFAFRKGLQRAGWDLKLPDDWSELVFFKDWNLATTEYSQGRVPKEPLADDADPEPLARAGDILTLVTSNRDAPATGIYGTVLAARMRAPDRGHVWIASGGNGPLRTSAIDVFKIEPRDPGFVPPFLPEMPRPPAGSAWILELNRTSLLLPARRLEQWTRAGLDQLKVKRLPRSE